MHHSSRFSVDQSRRFRPMQRGKSLLVHASSSGHKIYPLTPITFEVGRNSEGEPITAKCNVSVPLNGLKNPFALITAGFLLNGNSYASYASLLASHGIASATFDLGEISDDVTTAGAMRSIVSQCGRDVQLTSFIDPSRIILIGHSRGAKLSILAAQKEGKGMAVDSSVKALVLLDPVDGSSVTPSGPGYPSALPYLRQSASTIPTLIVGASKGDDVVPPESNYKQFYKSCCSSSPSSSSFSWLIDLPCGHLQFLDKQIAIFSLFSSPGDIDDSNVRSISQSAMVSFLKGIGLIGGSSAFEPGLRERLEAEAKTLMRLTPGSSSSLHGLSAAAKDTTSAFTSSTRPKTSFTYEQLMALKGGEIKKMLNDRSISCTDCFDKESLAKRLIDHST